MAVAGELTDLERQGLVAGKRSDPRVVAMWIQRSREDIALSRSIAADHPARSVTIAYEAGLRACAGILDLAGFRVRSQQGHHGVTIDAARRVLGQEFAPVLKRLDLARRYRNEDLYGEAPPPSAAQRDESINDAEALVAELERRLHAF